MAFQIKYVYDLVDRISPSLRKINSNVRKTERQIKRTTTVANSAFASMGRSVRNLSSKAFLPLRSSIGQLIIAFAGIEGIRRSVRVLADFDQSMATIKAVTEATAPELAKIRELTKELGITTEFTATQAARSAVLFGKAAFKTDEILQALPKTLDLATAGSLSLEQATDIAIGTLRGFGLEAREITRVTDILAKAAVSGNTTIGELGESMKFISAIAATSEIPLERIGAVLAVLADSSLKATMGGTGLRRIISALADPTREAIEVFKKLGLSQKDIDVQRRGLIPVLKTLAPLTKGVRGVANAFKVFGLRGAPAFAVISKNLDKIESLNKKMIVSEGAAKKLADTMRDTLTGDAKALLSAIEGNILALGEGGLTETLRKVTQSITKFFRAFGGGEAFDELGVSTQGFIQGLQLLGKIIGFTFKVLGFVFKVALAGLDAVLEGINLIIEPFLKLNNLIGEGIGKGLGKVIDFGKDLFSGEQKTENINTVNTVNTAKANQRQEPNNFTAGGQLDIILKNLPKGSSTNFKPASNNQMNVGINSVAQGG